MPHNRTNRLCLYECQTQAKYNSFLFLSSKSAFLFPSRDFTIEFSFKWADAAAESGQSVFNSSMKLHTVWILNKLLTYVRISEHPLEMRRDWHRDAERLTSELHAWSSKGLNSLGGDWIWEKTYTVWLDEFNHTYVSFPNTFLALYVHCDLLNFNPFKFKCPHAVGWTYTAEWVDSHVGCQR